jgi:hypothetical protein
MEADLIKHIIKVKLETEIGEKRKAVADMKLVNEKKKQDRLNELHQIKLRIIQKLEYENNNDQLHKYLTE